MYIKLVGARLILAGCGGYGIMMAVNHKREVASLRQVICVAEKMICELEYRLTPLPELCLFAAEQTKGALRAFFLTLVQVMDAQISPDLAECTGQALMQTTGIPDFTAAELQALGKTLGRFDLNGQINALQQCIRSCENKVEALEDQQPQRLRSYQTLGFCAGAALAILLF